MAKRDSNKPADEFIEMRQLLLRKRAKEKQTLIEKAKAKARDTAEMLKKDYKIEDVYLYGSLAWGGFVKGSDIDLFVKDFGGSYWEMFVKAEEVAYPFIISVVCEKDAHPNLREVVLRRGLPL